ncbi:DNA polymerase eta isoform X2 [Dermacentor silvarum]|uniref:DNA polymerase eta isoform X1 n=1 Tax=Dermacentor silvarum TaxID=543639 RepID=UPI0018998318|nr:DNA polymerase eta isoform X1 [Dermacentor silvarum]XP_049514118.1 DNA polymerase eta isoform X2 [Dermacentor silvarum]
MRRLTLLFQAAKAMATAPTPRHRAVVLVDMDCFYVQVEQRLAPDWNGKPCAVAQYNTFQGGGLIAVNYEARAYGVKRGMRGEEAAKLAKDLHLFRVPEVRGKADLTRYRDAGAEVLSVLCQFSEVVERASIDEAYLDLTEACKGVPLPQSADALANTFLGQTPKTASQSGVDDAKAELVAWLSDIEDPDCPDALLARAAALTEQIRAAVFAQTGFRCSAGIAHNKVLAKLACGLHKPNKQTVLTETGVPVLFATLPVHKLRKLGGKLGQDIQNLLQVEVVADVLRFSQDQLSTHFGHKTGTWLYQLVRGIDLEPVTPRKLAQSIGCGKNFRGKLALDTTAKVRHWLEQLSEELVERLLRDREQNHRIAQLLVISVRKVGQEGGTSRSCQLIAYDAARVMKDALATVMKLNTTAGASRDTWTPPLTNVSLAATKFRDSLEDGSQEISKFLVRQSKKADEPKKPTSAPLPPTTPQKGQKIAKESEDEGKGHETNEGPTPSHSLVTPKKEEELNDTLPFSAKLAMILQSPRDPRKRSDGSPPPVAEQHRVEEVKRVLPVMVSSTSPKKSVKVTATKTKKTSKKSAKKATSEAPKLSYFEKMWTTKNDADAEAASCVDSSVLTANAEIGVSVNSIDDASNDESRNLCDADVLPGPAFLKENSDDSTRSSVLSNVDSPKPSTVAGSVDTADKTSPPTSFDDAVCFIDTNRDIEGGVGGSEGHLSIDPSLLHKCEQCGKTVVVWKKEEHDDYHVALNLSRAERVATASPKVMATSRKRTASTTTKKTSRTKKACADKTRTLKDFFS